jgi:hypothetical protein
MGCFAIVKKKINVIDIFLFLMESEPEASRASKMVDKGNEPSQDGVFIQDPWLKVVECGICCVSVGGSRALGGFS